MARGPKTITEIAKELGVSASMLHRWRERFERELERGTQPSQNEREEIERLRRELRDVQAENAATTPIPANFLERLSEINGKLGVNLTPLELAHVLNGRLLGKEPGPWTAELNARSDALIGAPSPSSQILWLEFRLSREFGLTFKQLFTVYGTQYEVVEGQKEGTNVFIRPPKEGSVRAGTAVGVRLWTKLAMPDSEVVGLNPLPPEQR